MLQTAEEFSVPAARDLVKDLFRHRAAIYWADFLVFLGIGYFAAYCYLNAPLFSWQQLAGYLVAGFALFRVGSFIHEIVHMTGRQLLGFRIAWNLLAGIPMLMPSFFYGNHIDHHTTRHYGTGQDGEYLPLGSGALREILHFYSQVFLLPVAVFCRFLIITPLSLLHPGIRAWALARASSFVINLQYRRQVHPQAPRRLWLVIECACSARAWILIGCVLAGVVSWTRLPQLYALALLTLGLNYVRNLVAHHYRSDGAPITHTAQLADSVNLTGMPLLTELFFPLGLRYHALHHLFPTLPYHNLARAHRRLLARLPGGSVYHQTVQPGFWSVAWRLVARAGQRAAIGHRHRALGWYSRRRQIVERHENEGAPPAGKATAA